MTQAKQKTFQKFLLDLKKILGQKGIKIPSIFISYAWETGIENQELQQNLIRLKEDLSLLGMEVFLDINDMHGNMRKCMELIPQRDYILLIGTPKYKQRAEQHSLYLLSNSNDGSGISHTQNAVLLYENTNEVKFILDGKLLSTSINKDFNITDVKWIQEPNGIRRARLSVLANEIIENAISQISTNKITNVSYELGWALDKGLTAHNSLVPLRYKGEFVEAFPQDVLQEYLAHNFSNPEQYFLNMAELSPLGLIPALIPELKKMSEYTELLTSLKDGLSWSVEKWREQETKKPKDNDPLYISARGDVIPECHNSKPMDTHIEEFLQSKEADVLLLLGASGTGKSKFAAYLAAKEWANGNRIPILVNLTSIIDPRKKLMEEALLSQHVPVGENEDLKNKPILLIIDGFDEARNLGNLYNDNNLKQWKDIKVIITCRPETLTAKNYKLQFKPTDGNLWERYIAPFNSDEIDAYLEKYVIVKDIKESPWSDWRSYREHINKIPGLLQMIETPFLLRITAEVLPRIVKNSNSAITPGTKFTRRYLYEEFMNNWFQEKIERLKKNDLQGLTILDEGLDLEQNNEGEWDDIRIEVLREYSEHLAFKMYSANIDAVPIKALTEFPWIKEFFDNKPRPKLIRDSCPLVKNNEEFYTFLHKSLLEYLITPELLREVRSTEITTQYLNQQYLNHSPLVIRFLADAILEKPELQGRLWGILESSKSNKSLSIAAANAATILNAANISFAAKNLNYVNIPGADLSNGIFEGTSFVNANLKSVNLQGAWLNNADFRDANLEGIIFGEKPLINLADSPTRCVFSTDGRQILVANGNNISIYNSLDRKALGLLKGHTDSILTIYLIANKNLLISGSADKTIKIWDLGKRTCITTLTGHADAIKSVCYSDATNDILYSASVDNTIKVWDISQHRLLRTLNGHSGAVNGLSYDNISNQLISVSSDKTIKIWDPSTADLINTIENAHTAAITCVAYHESSNVIITGSEDRSIKIWNKLNKTCLRTLGEHTSGITSLKLHPNGEMLLSSADWDRTARLWLLETGSLLKTFEGHINFVMDVTVDPTHQTITTVSKDKTIRFWEINAPGIRKITEGHTWSVAYVAYSPNGDILASASWDNTVKLWDTQTGALLKTMRDPGHRDVRRNDTMIRSVAFSSDGKKLASGCDDGFARIWDPLTGALQKTLKGHTGGVKTVTFNPLDNNLLASGSVDTTIRVWDISEDTNTYSLEGHTATVREMAFNPDGTKLVSSAQDQTVRLWNIATRTAISIFSGHRGWVRTVSFHPNGREIVSGGSDDRNVIVWEPQTDNFVGAPENNFKIKYSLNGHMDFLTGVAFSPNGKFLVSVGMDNRLLLWNTDTKAIVFKTCSATPYAVCWGRKGSRIMLATANADSAVRNWNVNIAENRCILTLAWSSYQATLSAEHALLNGIKTSPENLELLRQRGISEEISQGANNQKDDTHPNSKKRGSCNVS